MKRLVILDFDGVLRGRSFDYMYKAYIEMSKYIGKDFREICRDLDSFIAWFNHDWIKNLDRMGIQKDQYHEINKVFHLYFDPCLEMFPWVENLLVELSCHNKLAILSGSSRHSVQSSLGHLNKYFEIVLGYKEVDYIKPHPQGIFFILDKCGASKKNTIMIGDTDVDIKAGKRAGVKTGAVTWGYDSEEGSIKLNPDYLFKSHEELFNIK